MLKVDELRKLQMFEIVPVTLSALTDTFSQYKAPESKVRKMELEGELIRLKRGLYVVAPHNLSLPLSKELLANHIYGPSYVSFETALSWYGLIPERVHMVKSLTTKRTRSFNTSIGRFEYISSPDNYYSIGIGYGESKKKYTYLLALPEKALCDMVVFALKTRIQSLSGMRNYLQEDLRIDFSAVETWDTTIVEECIKYGRKKKELNYLLRIIRDECF